MLGVCGHCSFFGEWFYLASEDIIWLAKAEWRVSWEKVLQEMRQDWQLWQKSKQRMAGLTTSGSGNRDADTERRDLEGEFKHREDWRSKGNEEGWIRFMVSTFFSFYHTPLLVVKYFSACIQYTNFTILFFYSSFQWIFLCISILEVAGIN